MSSAPLIQTTPIKQIHVNRSPLCTQLRSLSSYLRFQHFQGALQLHGSQTCLMMVYSTKGDPVVVVVELGPDTIVVISRRPKNNQKFALYNRKMPYEIRANLVLVKAIFAKEKDTDKWVSKQEELVNFVSQAPNGQSLENLSARYRIGSWLEIKPNEFFSSYRQLDHTFENTPGRRSYVVWPDYNDFYKMVQVTKRLNAQDILQINNLVRSNPDFNSSEQYETRVDPDDVEAEHPYNVNNEEVDSLMDEEQKTTISDDDDDDNGVGVGVFATDDDLQKMQSFITNELKESGVSFTTE